MFFSIEEHYPFKLYSFQWLILINSLFSFNYKYHNIRLILFFTLNLLFKFERVRLVLTSNRWKKTYQHAGIPAQERIRTERSLKKSSWLPISDYITTRRSLPVADEKIKPPSLSPPPASLIMIILTEWLLFYALNVFINRLFV